MTGPTDRRLGFSWFRRPVRAISDADTVRYKGKAKISKYEVIPILVQVPILVLVSICHLPFSISHTTTHHQSVTLEEERQYVQ